MKLEGKYYETVSTSEKDGKNQQEILTKFGTRHFQLLIIFISLTVLVIVRAHLGVSIVAMTSHSDILENDTRFENDTKFENDSKVGRPIHKVFFQWVSNAIERCSSRTAFVLRLLRIQTLFSKFLDEPAEFMTIYNWPKPVQEIVLSSFFLGYCVMTMPFALICQRYGGKIPLQISLFVNAIASLLTPLLTRWGGWKAVCFCRVVQGLSQAGTYPSLQTLLAEWVPLSERGTMSSYVYTGSTLGTIVGFQLSGLLCSTTWSWPSVFYTVGVLCLLCFIFITVFGASSPLVHKTISEAEKKFIRHEASTSVQKSKIPWRAILTSRPVWATLVSQFGCSATFVFTFTQVPSYIHYILSVNVKNSGLLSSLPFIVSFFTSISFGVLSDYLTNRKILSIGAARRTFNNLSQFGAAIGLIATSFATSTVSAMAFLVLTLALYPGLHVGWMVNQIDIAPNYVGTLMAIGNTMGNIGINIMPVVVSYVVQDVTNVHHWRIMLSIVAGITVVTNVVYVVFMSPEVQPWNDWSRETDEEGMKDKLKMETKDLKNSS